MWPAVWLGQPAADNHYAAQGIGNDGIHTVCRGEEENSAKTPYQWLLIKGRTIPPKDWIRPHQDAAHVVDQKIYGYPSES
jgi:hypothetical protein